MSRFQMGLGALVLVVLISGAVFRWVVNPGVVQELHEEPDGERAKKVMLLTLPSGKEVLVNYRREGQVVYAAADFPWWKELREGGGPGAVFIRGKEYPGFVRAVLDDPELRDTVFDKLRPTAPRFLGTLLVIDLDQPETAALPG